MRTDHITGNVKNNAKTERIKNVCHRGGSVRWMRAGISQAAVLTMPTSPTTTTNELIAAALASEFRRNKFSKNCIWASSSLGAANHFTWSAPLRHINRGLGT